MSAYASLPGSFLPPFFAFGAPSSSSENDTVDVGDGGDTKNTSCVQKNNTNSSITPKEPSCPYSRSSSSGDISPSAFKALALSPQESNELGSTDTTAARTPPSPSDIIIAIRSARVDPVALIKSLTSTGSNIARRTANFIHTAATTESSSSSNNEGASSSRQPGAGAVGKEEAGERAVDEEVSVFTPGLCLEDTDSDDEYSMYDYSDDFSTPNDDSEDSSHDDKNLHSNNEHNNTSNEDPSAIEFELSITFQGRKYNATRAFPTFVKLRDDLLREFNDGRDQDGEVVVQKGGRRNRRGGVRSKSPINATIEDNESCLLNGSIGNNGMRKSVSKENVSIPELPRVSPESLGHGGGYALATGVARSGFALLQATAQHYCPEMERWMREVIMQYPCSQSLSSFLWEPLSSSNANWETIGEGTELVGNIDASCPSNEGLAADSNKPPLHTRSKSRSSNSLYKSRFKSSQSMGSLNSIDEGNDIDCDDHSI